MNENPYLGSDETPGYRRTASTQSNPPEPPIPDLGFNWKSLCIGGLMFAFMCYVVGSVVPWFWFLPTAYPALAWAVMVIAVLANVGVFAGLFLFLVALTLSILRQRKA